MAIDYTIEYNCYPKQELTAEGILERLKGRARADTVVTLFRNNGDNRPIIEIGFELAHTSVNGTEETRVVMVQDLLDKAAELAPYEHYCQRCPANNTGSPFGCIGQIEYPISGKAEVWLLTQLPNVEEPLPWLLLRQGVEEFKSDGSRVTAMRGTGQPYFKEQGVLARSMGEFVITTNQVFEMLFLLGHISPSYAAMLLIFFKVIRRDMEAMEIMNLSKSLEDGFERYPFLFKPEPDDDETITQLKRFFRALYLAWGLNARLRLDV
jgi:hypothetical protein